MSNFEFLKQKKEYALFASAAIEAEGAYTGIVSFFVKDKKS